MRLRGQLALASGTPTTGDAFAAVAVRHSHPRIPEPRRARIYEENVDGISEAHRLEVLTDPLEADAVTLREVASDNSRTAYCEHATQ